MRLRSLWAAVAGAIVVSTAMTPAATADTVPTGSAEGCIALDNGLPAVAPGLQVVYGGRCRFRATRPGGYIATGDWRVTIVRGARSIVLTPARFGDSCHYGIEPGDVATAEVGPGGRILIGREGPGQQERYDPANANRYRECLRPGARDPNVVPADVPQPSPLPAVDVADPDSWASPNHPAYSSVFDGARADRTLVDDLHGCRSDHPYMTWLTDATQTRFDGDLSSMRGTLVAGYVPATVVPNEPGYPDTYWRWVKTVPSGRSSASAEPWNTRDAGVDPGNIEWLLMVPAAPVRATPRSITPESPERAHEGWVPGGAVYAMPAVQGAPLELYNGCRPFEGNPSGQQVSQSHFHLWPSHHVHPMVMDAPHLCDETGQLRPSAWPARETHTGPCR